MHYVYMIECEDGSYYTGYSTNPERRFKEHVLGKGAKYTRSHKPKKLVMQCLCLNKSAALSLESRIKQLSHSEKVILIREYADLEGRHA